MPEIKQTRSFLLLGANPPCLRCIFLRVYTCFISKCADFSVFPDCSAGIPFKFVYFKAHKAGFDAHLPTVLNTFCLLHHIYSHFTFVVPASRTSDAAEADARHFFPISGSELIEMHKTEETESRGI